MTHFGGFVELTEDMAPDVLRTLALAAYRSSHHEQVALVLNGLPPSVIDRHLDSIVLSAGAALRGVRYLSAHPVDERLLQQAARSRFVVVSSPSLATALDARGIPYIRRQEAMAYLSNSVWPHAGSEGLAFSTAH